MSCSIFTTTDDIVSLKNNRNNILPVSKTNNRNSIPVIYFNTTIFNSCKHIFYRFNKSSIQQKQKSFYTLRVICSFTKQPLPHKKFFVDKIFFMSYDYSIVKQNTQMSRTKRKILAALLPKSSYSKRYLRRPRTTQELRQQKLILDYQEDSSVLISKRTRITRHLRTAYDDIVYSAWYQLHADAKKN